jgi:hypothetical protein
MKNEDVVVRIDADTGAKAEDVVLGELGPVGDGGVVGISGPEERTEEKESEKDAHDENWIVVTAESFAH